MTLAVLLLSLSWILGVALLLLLGVFGPWPAWLKTVSIVAFAGLGIAQFEGWSALRGWAADAPLPPRFIFHSAVIHEPGSGSAGSIELWLSALNPRGEQGAPRAYKQPYNRADHRVLDAAMDRMRNGRTQFGEALAEAQWLQLPDGRQRAPTAASMRLSDLPQPALPEK
jgi:hypothetical protein